MKTRLASTVLAIALLACASCSSSSTSTTTAGAVTQTIGPAGGVITVDGATVTFPKDAVAAPIGITISSTDAIPDGYVALSKVFKCEPSGTTFSQPVTMQMPFTDDGKGGSMFWSSGSDPAFKNLGGTAQAGTMTATVQHFSSGFVGRTK